QLHTTAMFWVLVESLRSDPARLPTLDFSPPPLDGITPLFAPRPGELETVTALMPRRGGAMAPVILLNPNASDLIPLRQWPNLRYVELAKRLLERFPEAWIGFTGAPTEAGVIERLMQSVGSDRCVCFAGKTTLRQLMVLYGLCELLVTNDSGPAHFASLT